MVVTNDVEDDEVQIIELPTTKFKIIRVPCPIVEEKMSSPI